MKKYSKLLIINFLILIFFVELLSFALAKFNIVPDGITPTVTLNAHEKFSYWHPINSNFKIAKKCWKSYVKFNSLGIKSSKEIPFKKIKKRIAILGDSMTENLQLSNDNDFVARLQKLLPQYEIINFSVSSTGLADQIEIYKNLIKKFDVDYLFLYLTYNDFSDNHISSYRVNRKTFKVLDDNIIEVNPDKSEFFKEYNSNINKFKREKLIFFKKISYTYKTYSFLRYEKRFFYPKVKKLKLNNESQNVEEINEEKKKIFNFLMKKAKKEIFDEVKTLIFLNSDNLNFLNPSQDTLAIKEILKDYNFFDPSDYFISYLEDDNKLSIPYVGYTCDAHYSELGADLLAKYTFKKFILETKNHQ